MNNCMHICGLLMGTYFLFIKYLRVGLLAHMVNVHLTLQETAEQFSKSVLPSYIPISNAKVQVAPNLCHNLLLPVFKIWAISMDV